MYIDKSLEALDHCQFDGFSNELQKFFIVE